MVRDNSKIYIYFEISQNSKIYIPVIYLLIFLSVENVGLLVSVGYIVKDNFDTVFIYPVA